MIYADKKRITADNNRILTDRKLIHADITYKVRRAVFNVFNELGFGHKEQVYQKALIKEFNEMNLSYKSEQNLKVKYKGEVVGNYRPDFIVEDRVIVEIKSADFIPKSYEKQLIHYLKTTGYRVGLLVNFGAPRLVIKRLVWSGKSA